MQDQICLITGATSGIGLATARALATRGANLVLVGRDPAKTTATVACLRDQTGNTAIDYLLADLSAQSQVRYLADEFQRRYPRLDVLINNAGAFFWRRQLSPDGIEMTLAVNHLAPFLLTNLLLDTLKASAPARVINVSSTSHRSAHLDLEDLQSVRRYRGMAVYGKSKLAMLHFTYELARQLEGSGLTVNALHPGFVATNIGTNNGRLFRLFVPLLRFVAISPEQGARTSVYLASSPDVAGVTGRYFVDCAPVRSAPASYDQATTQRLWDLSAALTGLQPHQNTHPNR